MNAAALERNIQIYPWYQAAAGFLPWLPIFFLFFYQYVPLSDALQLSAIYYLSVFILEVPSGYFSDKFGRRITLILGACFAMSAYAIFAISSDFLPFVVGQFLLAGFFSFKSGSDNALLYDSLKQLSRENEYANHEAKATRYSMIALAVSAFLGGVSGVQNLTFAYLLALLGAGLTLYLCLKFNEPQRIAKAAPFLQQIKICAGKLKNGELRWIFIFFVIAYSLQHVPAEFNQPYVTLLQIDIFGSLDSSPFISGCMVAVSMIGGALGASASIKLLSRYGARKLLLYGLVIMLLIIAGMAVVLHPAVLLLVLLRNFPMALSEAPMLSVIAPLIESSYRATYLSLQSLAGRLGFAILLFSLSGLVDNGQEQTMQWPDLQLVLLISVAVAAIGFTLLLWYRPKLQQK